jgi:2-succinyl-6-hydroxy-2,4-cyclohexadiene-1-carboxylate synthase
MVKFEHYKFHYSFTGSWDTPPILFLHGFIGSSDDFNHGIKLLSDKFSCLAVDLPGHGKTQVIGDEEYYTMPHTANALIKLLDKLNIEKCSLVGYSMGGRLAFYLMLHFPERFSQVVIESASPGLKSQEEQSLRIKQDSKLAKEIETSDFASFLLKWYNQPLFKSLKEHQNFNDLIKRRLENNPLELSKSLRQMGIGCQPSLWDKLETNKISLLLLVGEYDHKFIEINAEMAKRCAVANIKIIKNCGHNIHFEQMPQWVKYVKEFCS